MNSLNHISQIIWGNVSPTTPYGGLFGTPGPTRFVTNIIRFMIFGAGLFALINIVLAGYAFMSAGGDAGKVAGAWAKIWQSLIGLTVAVGSFIIAAIVGQLLFGSYNYLLQLRVFGPGD
jgi:hypothetical protein